MATFFDICEQEDLLLELSDIERGALWRAVILYRRGIAPGEELMRSVRPVFAMIRAGIDAYENHRKTISEARKVFGSKGGMAKASKSKQKLAYASKSNGLPESAPPPSSPCITPPVSPLRGNTAPQRAVFVKPSVEKISEYCRERGNGVDAQGFFDFYESKGWKIGKNAMKDWKAAVRTWERNGYGAGGGLKKKGKYDGMF